MQTRFLFIGLIMIGFVLPVFGTDQLLAENPDEPNQFGYFVTTMSIAIVGSLSYLESKNGDK